MKREASLRKKRGSAVRADQHGERLGSRTRRRVLSLDCPVTIHEEPCKREVNWIHVEEHLRLQSMYGLIV